MTHTVGFRVNLAATSRTTVNIPASLLPGLFSTSGGLVKVSVSKEHISLVLNLLIINSADTLPGGTHKPGHRVREPLDSRLV